MKMKEIRVVISILCCGAALIFGACSTQPAANMNQLSSNANAQSGTAPATAQKNTNSGPWAGGTGDPIDTSAYDAEIERLRPLAEKKGSSDADRLALSKAYSDRGDALTKARQYRAALGDYRRALKYDASNRAAQQGASMIVLIMRQMGREVPAEGEEPAPLPFKPDANAGKSESSIEREQSAPLVKSH